MAHDIEDALVESLVMGTDLLLSVVLSVPEAKGAIMAWREVGGVRER